MLQSPDAQGPGPPVDGAIAAVRSLTAEIVDCG
jgi:hypothetical protein